MSHKPPSKIASSVFLDLFLTYYSSAAEREFRATPLYEQFTQSQSTWSAILKTLDDPTIETYESTVNRAFAEYETLLKGYFWSLGLINVAENHLSTRGGSEPQQNAPGALIAAEDKLTQVCNQFSELLSAESKEKFDDYFHHRKSAVDIVGAYCCRHGMDFMNALLTRAGLNNGQNGEEASHSTL